MVAETEEVLVIVRNKRRGRKGCYEPNVGS
jgi:hypothetical protein